MFLASGFFEKLNAGFPRASGDVPYQIELVERPVVFSPRERGCSLGRLICLRTARVFPARAGMFR